MTCYSFRIISSNSRLYSVSVLDKFLSFYLFKTTPEKVFVAHKFLVKQKKNTKSLSENPDKGQPSKWLSFNLHQIDSSKLYTYIKYYNL